MSPLEKAIARLAKKYKPVDIFDEFARVYEEAAKERGKLSKEISSSRMERGEP